MMIQWYPGHMAKAKRVIEGNLKIVDMLVELADARIPLASRNPELTKIAGNKPSILGLNKADLADPVATGVWVSYFHSLGVPCIDVVAKSGAGVADLTRLMADVAERSLKRLGERGRKRPVRAMVVGVPNVGKSSLINRIAGRGSVKTGDRPGITRSKQWIAVSRDLELLDTPGLLWPKWEDPKVGLKLAMTGIIADESFDAELVGIKLLDVLLNSVPSALANRFKLAELGGPRETLEMIGRKRGCLRPGGLVDMEKAGIVAIHDFREGKFGKITLESPLLGDVSEDGDELGDENRGSFPGLDPEEG